jgi:hypothetical protein
MRQISFAAAAPSSAIVPLTMCLIMITQASFNCFLFIGKFRFQEKSWKEHKKE